MGGGKLQDKIQGIFKVQHNKEVQRRIQGESIQIRTVYKDLQSMTAGGFLMALPTDEHSTFSRDQFRSLIALRYSGISPLGWPPFLPTHLMCDCKHEIVDPQHIFYCKHLNKGNQGWTWVHDEMTRSRIGWPIYINQRIQVSESSRRKMNFEFPSSLLLTQSVQPKMHLMQRTTFIGFFRVPHFLLHRCISLYRSV